MQSFRRFSGRSRQLTHTADRCSQPAHFTEISCFELPRGANGLGSGLESGEQGGGVQPLVTLILRTSPVHFKV